MFRTIETAHGRKHHELMTRALVQKLTSFEEADSLRQLLCEVKTIDIDIKREYTIDGFYYASLRLTFNDDSEGILKCNNLRLVKGIFGSKLSDNAKAQINDDPVSWGEVAKDDGLYEKLTIPGVSSCYQFKRCDISDVNSFDDITDIEQLLQVTTSIDSITQYNRPFLQFTFIDGSKDIVVYPGAAFTSGFLGSRLTDKVLEAFPDISSRMPEKTQQQRKEHFANLKSKSQAAAAAPSGVVQSLGNLMRRYLCTSLPSQCDDIEPVSPKL
jgi:hypothetical protein